MARFFTLLVVALLIAVGLFALAGYLTYGTTPPRSGDVSVEGLNAPVAVAFTEADVPIVEAETEVDLFTGLGYVHALQSAWPMALWRQVAAGRLGSWFEDSTAIALDRHLLALGLGDAARTTYETLSDEERALLDAYARGVNRAFARGRLNEGDEFVLFDVRAERWEPWDALAVERLLAYLGTAPVTADSSAQAALAGSAPLRAFAAADSLLRATLYADGFDHALAFTRSDSTGTALVQRHVLGRSALPVFREVVLRQGDRNTLVASMPGTFAFPAGYGDRAWSVFLSGAAALSPSAGEPPAPSYARVVTRSGNEALVTTYRRPGALVLFDPTDTAPRFRRDSTGAVVDTLDAPSWTVQWQGFRPGTDLGAWRALLRGETPSFSLLPGDGLVLDGGAAQTLGSPAVVRDVPGGTLVGAHPWADYVADRLAVDSVAFGASEMGEGDVLTDAFSPWAARLAPPIVATLGGPDDVADEFRAPSAYLRSWDYRYTPSSVGSSIFDTWMAVFRAGTGALPDLAEVTAAPPTPDSLGRVPERAIDRQLAVALRRALDLLQEEHGEIGAAWRWQNVQRAQRSYPLFERHTGERFAPTVVPDGGHPTTFAWGPSPAFPGPEATNAWAAAGGAAAADTSVRIRHRQLYDATYRARALADPVEPDTLSLARAPEPDLRLVPISN